MAAYEALSDNGEGTRTWPLDLPTLASYRKTTQDLTKPRNRGIRIRHIVSGQWARIEHPEIAAVCEAKLHAGLE